MMMFSQGPWLHASLWQTSAGKFVVVLLEKENEVEEKRRKEKKLFLKKVSVTSPAVGHKANQYTLTWSSVRWSQFIF